MFDTRFFSSVMLPVILALIMTGIGTSLTFSDFRNIFRFPRGLIVGLLGQMVALPLFALLVAYLAPLSDSMKVGIVLVAACPGGATSNLIVHLFRGNVAMSVSFTIVNSFLTLISIPAWVLLGLHLFMKTTREVSPPVNDMLIHVLLMTVIPCTIGILLNRKFPLTIAKMRKTLDIIMPILMAVGMVAAIFFEKKEDEVSLSADLFLQVLPWVLLLNLGGLVLGYLLARVFKLGNRNRMTISVEVGMQNTGMAIALATSVYILNDRTMAIPAAVYAMFTFFTAVGWAALIRRKALLHTYRNRKTTGQN
ncbi:MAG: bile acid:sodium symporter family protein [Flavobacteriales bacterium]|nr:bile acid:sodium symporter family protein [Flavobacteriales bacterium]